MASKATLAGEIVSAYRDVTSYPTPTSADINISEGQATVVLQTLWSQHDLDRKEKTTLLRSHTINIATGSTLGKLGPQEVKNELWNKVSPSGKLRAVVRTGKDKQNEDKHYIEIFDSTRKLKTIDILALEKHGKIIDNDGQFGSFEWSSSEGHLLYLAEKKKAKTGSYFDPKAYKDSGSGDDDLPNEKPDLVRRGDEFEHIETWGEQLTERVHPVVCVLDIESNTVSVLENIPDDESAGQAMWGPDDAGIVVCTWKHSPYRLGLKFCCQRKSALYYLDLQKGSLDLLSQDGRAVRFPRFSPDMSKLIYLDVPEGGPHNQCARLVKIDWATRNRQVVVDEVKHAPDLEFPGIYTYNLARQVWFDDNIHIAMSTSWRSISAVIVVNTDNGKITRLEVDTADTQANINPQASYGFLGVKRNVVMMYYSTLNQPYNLLLAQVNDPSNLSSISWIYPDDHMETLDWLTFSVLVHKPSKSRINPKYENVDYESILCLPKQSQSGTLPPLIVFSHGGPNSVFDTSFNIISAFFCTCGYAVLMVNYRGSLGFGQDSILSLTGNIGTQDVMDVESAMVEVIAKGLVDGSRIFKFGGSHGGFLTTHLIGQYPDTFRAAATRNPVVNLASMFSTTDINDWIFAQAALEFDYRTLADDKLLPYLWLCSPMSHIDKVKTPILLMIGLDDKRVPPAQSFEYYKALKARNVSVRCLTYPKNNHSISDVDAEADCMVNTIVWFNNHLP
ncbi:unnamed protein product [Lymnaea stagnalis]|uniref:Prolyl endopeptidase n=1 Tax=Lymnaea stagnalis TaxID=6523 RepID=A0AAV2HF90_LYMST